MYMHDFNQTYGTKGEFVSCPKVNTGFFQHVKKTNNIRAIFAAHDHNNDYGGFYSGVELKYVRKTGFGSYGPKNMQNGGTIINLKEYTKSDGTTDFSYTHNTILADGSIEEKPPLK